MFAELTKSKKGSEYVALFTYFSFEGMFGNLQCSKLVLTMLSLVAHHFRRRTTKCDQRNDTVFRHAGELDTGRKPCHK